MALFITSFAQFQLVSVVVGSNCHWNISSIVTSFAVLQDFNKFNGML